MQQRIEHINVPQTVFKIVDRHADIDEARGLLDYYVEHGHLPESFRSRVYKSFSCGVKNENGSVQ